MIKLIELERYLADYLNVKGFSDYCVNGIQLEGAEIINRIVVGVSVSERLIKEAVRLKADSILVHHGLFWKSSPHPFELTGFQFQRVKLLIENNISLLGFHLPLDAHRELGNNALIAECLGLQNIEFLEINGMQYPIATCGDLPTTMEFEQFVSHANTVLETEGTVFNFTRSTIRRAYILSGGGAGYFMAAVKAGADIMITGELKEDVIRSAEECGLSLFAAGHYNSEKWGIRALGDHLAEKYEVEVKFVNIPNPV